MLYENNKFNIACSCLNVKTDASWLAQALACAGSPLAQGFPCAMFVLAGWLELEQGRYSWGDASSCGMLGFQP